MGTAHNTRSELRFRSVCMYVVSIVLYDPVTLGGVFSVHLAILMVKCTEAQIVL